MRTTKFLSLCISFIFLISILVVLAEGKTTYQLKFIYDGKNLSFDNLSKEAPPGIYNLEILSSGGEVVDTSEIVIIKELPLVLEIFVPYHEGGTINLYYPDGTLMFSRMFQDISEVSQETTG